MELKEGQKVEVYCREEGETQWGRISHVLPATHNKWPGHFQLETPGGGHKHNLHWHPPEEVITHKTITEEIVETANENEWCTFLVSLKEQVYRGNVLTEKQIGAAINTLKKLCGQQELGEGKALFPVTDHRIAVTGTVTSKWWHEYSYESRFDVYKMTVECDSPDGGTFRTTGTVPKSLVEAGVQVGDKIKFEAKFSKEGMSLWRGYHQRPGRGEIIEKGQ